MAGVVDDLKLLSKKRDEAMAAVKAHQEAVRKLMEQARVRAAAIASAPAGLYRYLRSSYNQSRMTTH